MTPPPSPARKSRRLAGLPPSPVQESPQIPPAASTVSPRRASPRSGLLEGEPLPPSPGQESPQMQASPTAVSREGESLPPSPGPESLTAPPAKRARPGSPSDPPAPTVEPADPAGAPSASIPPSSRPPPDSNDILGVSKEELENIRATTLRGLRMGIDPFKAEREKLERERDFRLGKAALEAYNDKHKEDPYELVEGGNSADILMLNEEIMFFHCNFLARAKKADPGSQPELFFAELTLQKRKRNKKQVTLVTRLDMNPSNPKKAPEDHCYRCTVHRKIYHPSNRKYEAGHMHDKFRAWINPPAGCLSRPRGPTGIYNIYS